jgi:hypothetical protein
LRVARHVARGARFVLQGTCYTLHVRVEALCIMGCSNFTGFEIYEVSN